jgi:CDGSH-type Zn-finger protein
MKKIRASENGPLSFPALLLTLKKEICNDSGGYCSTWREVMTYPWQEQYALCRCGQSKNKSFCDGTQGIIHFDGTETADDTPYLERAEKITRTTLSLTDAEHIYVHARFCMRAGGIWTLTKQSGSREARDNAIEEAASGPSGRLVVWDRKTGKALEPEFEKSIVVIEYPPRNEHGPLWVRGGIPGWSGL